ncbi:cyclopropane-fatty-acyl-phospholipid synthase family protein [Roseovarius sp. Pro17]|uniref:cyclopropane-fatty-acyl-phospholipid synthase family protein n=1 Tax=Roseovarius sp. Pro17 TaxID=3108175 RepID=UPI002D791FB8|nr:cyclopropane-fatty-acyl-phospholipid synthase family protein [Roseovarius sp. Pro17]
MWIKALHSFMTYMVQQGRLSITYPDGNVQIYEGQSPGPKVAIALNDPALPRRIVLSPKMGISEGYVDGRLTIENDDLEGFLRLCIGNMAARGGLKTHWPLEMLRYLGRRAAQFNPASRSRANVAHHYDLSGALYDLFLDDDRQYSCAYFPRPDMTLEEAQDAKKAHIARKLLLRPGMRVLDIGCGWGGMGLTLARDYDAKVVGVTLSEEQHKIAVQRAKDAGLEDRADFRLMDYRDVDGQFDRIVSVGMFEHVGVPHYREYFDKIRELLTPEGVALIHTIGRAEPPGTTSPWIQKYIFPGGYVPALSEMSRAVENAGLMPTDVEIWRLHYADTLRHWYNRFMQNIDKARALYDERFCRMWRYYLLASELTFRLGRQVVFQMQLAKAHGAVPLSRDYLYRSN